jgi:hypothetical protein
MERARIFRAFRLRLNDIACSVANIFGRAASAAEIFSSPLSGGES